MNRRTLVAVLSLFLCASTAFGQKRPERTIDDLVKMLADPDPRVYGRGYSGLEHRSDAVVPLVQMLSTETRSRVLDRVTDLLMGLLGGDDKTYPASGRAAGDAAVPVLLKMCHDQPESDGKAILLGKIGTSDEVLPTCRVWLAARGTGLDADRRCRLAVQILTHETDPSDETLSVLEKLAPDSSFQYDVFRGLASCPKAEPTLVRLATTAATTDIRVEAIKHLAGPDPDRTGYRHLQSAAASAVFKDGSDSTVQDICLACDKILCNCDVTEPDGRVHPGAAWLVAKLRDPIQQTRAAAILADADPRTVTPSLLALLKDPDQRTRFYAAEIFVRLRYAEFHTRLPPELVAEAMNDPDPNNRVSLAKFLLYNQDAVPLIGPCTAASLLSSTNDLSQFVPPPTTPPAFPPYMTGTTPVAGSAPSGTKQSVTKAPLRIPGPLRMLVWPVFYLLILTFVAGAVAQGFARHVRAVSSLPPELDSGPLVKRNDRER